ncbi:MAG: hypothetical protein JJU42_01170 [Rhodobacteraceae bacterium]|nr:hypothetical protein [Paracoccaceae bacterium]
MIAVVFGKALAERAILDCEGVGDADGNLTPVTSEGTAALLDIWPIFERFRMGYVAQGLELEAEQNACALLPTGAGRELLQSLPGAVPGLPASPERAAHP